MNRQDALIILNALPNSDPVKIKNLLERFPNPEDIFVQTVNSLLSVEGISRKSAEKILCWKNYFDLDKEYKLIQQNNVNLVLLGEKDYPEQLANIDYPPSVLYVKGTLDIDVSISIVGSRNASYYGIETAKKFGMVLAARGVTVTSGFARGIDTASHKGALRANGKTIAVLGSGIDVVYPAENIGLIDKVVERGGAILSEFPMGTEPFRHNFPRRNRIISGLSIAVVVVEAAARSGSLITARLAAEHGKEVFSVPWRIDSCMSQGTNVLIQDGARPVMRAEDILQELDIVTEINSHKDNKKKAISVQLSESENQIYDMMSPEDISFDDLTTRSGLPAEKVWETVSVLELKGLIVRLPGNRFVRKNSL